MGQIDKVIIFTNIIVISFVFLIFYCFIVSIFCYNIYSNLRARIEFEKQLYNDILKTIYKEKIIKYISLVEMEEIKEIFLLVDNY
jgi:hypothetical protein